MQKVLSRDSEFRPIPYLLSYRIQGTWSYADVSALLEVNFMQGVGYGSVFILSVVIQCEQHHLLKMLSSLRCVLLTFMGSQFYFGSRDPAFVPMQCYRC